PPVGDPDGDLDTTVFEIVSVAVQSRRAYGLFGRTTRVSLSKSWWTPVVLDGDKTPSITPIRRAVIYTQTEVLRLVSEPVEDDVAGSVIDLDRTVTALPPDRLLIVEGDLAGSNGVHAAELVRVAGTSSSFATKARTVRLLRPSKAAPNRPDVVEVA